MEIKKSIFGKNVKLIIPQTKIGRIIHDELEYYSTFSKNEDEDLIIEFVKDYNWEFAYNNPRIHFEFEDGFGFDINFCKIKLNLTNKPLYVEILVKNKAKGILNFVKRFLNYEFNTQPVWGQILHELIFVPMCYLYDDIAPIHCSGIKNNNGAFLFGGTGGVGKTSILLTLSKRGDISFVNDDIGIISKDGFVYPNYAFPKIYAYNTKNNAYIEKELLKNKTLANKLQWRIIKNINPSKVRRRIKPDKLYSIDKKQVFNLDSYFIFNIGLFDDIRIKPISVETAATATLEIFKSEYSIINRHFFWHKFNSVINANKIKLDLDSVFKTWHCIYLNAFKNVNLYVINVPQRITQSEFTEKMLETISHFLVK